MDLDLFPAEQDLLHPIVEPYMKIGKPRIDEQSNVPQGLVEAATQGSDDHEAFRVHLDYAVDGQLEIRFILIFWKDFESHPIIFELSDCSCFSRIQVADDEIGSDPKGQGMTRPAIGTEDGITRAYQSASFHKVGEFPVGKDNNALQKKTILLGGWS